MNYRLDDPLNTAPCGFLVFTDGGTIVTVNATLAELLEYEPGELAGEKIETILPIASRIFYQTHFFPLLRMQGKVSEIYFSARSKSRRDIPMLVNGVERRKRGEITVNECIFIPIQQRIQYEEEILNAKKIAEAAVKARERAEIALRQQYERALLLKQVTGEIHSSIELPPVFEFVTREIRQHFGVDRVGIFQFYADSNHSSGEFVAESASAEFVPALGKIVRDSCFAHRSSYPYPPGKIQSIADIDEVALQDCYRELLKKFQIRANLVFPLLNTGQLWGLLCVNQCTSPREWQDFEIDFVGQVSGQLAIAIQQADLFQKLQEELAERTRTEIQLQRMQDKLLEANHLLEQLANIDRLTGIANRRCFDTRLDEEWQRLQRERQPLSLLLFDVDFFKRYNDTYGHLLGDDCLSAIARAAKPEIHRPADLIARYGGEEFVVILPDTDTQGAIAVADRLHTAIHALNIPHTASNASDRVTISLGIATTIPTAEALPTSLIAQADHALYRAKQLGRNRSAIFSEDSKDRGG